MTEMNDALQSEFGVVAGWTADELVDLDDRSQLVGACRGSGGPAVLSWLAESLLLKPGARFLDVGAGLGGPASWVAGRYRVRPIAVEPMIEACQGSTRLFPHNVIAAAAHQLPFPDGSFDAAWMIGVLDTVPDPTAALRDVRRVLRGDGRVALMVHTANRTVALGAAPVGNHFQRLNEVRRSLNEAGFLVVDELPADELPEAPRDWTIRQQHVSDAVTMHHDDDPHWTTAHDQAHRFAQLVDDGCLEAYLFSATCTPDRQRHG